MTIAPKALLLESIHPVADSILIEAGFQVQRIASALAGAELDRALAGASVVGIRSKTEMRAAQFANHASLVAVGCFCIGTNQVDLLAAEASGSAVFNSPFSNTRSVAEMTIAEAICLFRRLFEKSAQLHAGRWDKSASHSHEVRGRTLGIVGYGHIGSQVSVLAESLGMRVIFFDVVRKLPLGNAQSRPSLEALLRDADCVTLHVPETQQTMGFIGARQIALMKPGAILINNARGSVVDLDALAAALRDGRLGGAAIDVFPIHPCSHVQRRSSLHTLVDQPRRLKNPSLQKLQRNLFVFGITDRLIHRSIFLKSICQYFAKDNFAFCMCTEMFPACWDRCTHFWQRRESISTPNICSQILAQVM